MPEEPITLIGQFISSRTMATGGLRVSIDIPETRIKDCALASTLALQRQWAEITVTNYDPKDITAGQARAKRRPGAPIE